MKRCSSRYTFILFENLFKPRQRRLAVGMVTDFATYDTDSVSSIHNLKTVLPSTTSKQCFELTSSVYLQPQKTSSVLSTTYDTDSVSSIHNLKTVLELTSSVLSTT
ncbi:hypothetical protein [Streptococcus pneumoniae]|uniref:hypothetical protein n=1 Tax=Streptococcus pneumoniae TaxID=1313 RepID=UPI00115622BA|nr:hypothetical protein [Streptococcus pneumoniae]